HPRGAREERPLWGSGTIEGTSIIISAEVSGTVQAVHAAEGDYREAGEILVTLDPADLELQYAMHRAEAAIADAERRLVETGARTEDILQAEARARRLRRDLEAAREDYERMARLLEAESVTRSRYEDAELRLSRTETELVAAEQDLERVRNLARPEEREIAHLRAERAEYGRRLAERRLDRAVVHAPRSAYVDRLLVEEGEFVQPGRPLVRLVHRDPVWITLFVAQGDLSLIAPGDTAEVLVDAYPDRRFGGRIVRIAEEAEFTPSNVQTRDDRSRQVFAVKVEIPNAELLLRPGMGAEAEFPEAQFPEARRGDR
ncbi:MAG: HlyD family secretion protein, partial [Spirochaetaceae bacterium]